MIEIMKDVLADNLVEVISEMSQEQRDKFVKAFVSKWPDLAGQISFSIDANLQDVEVKDPALKLDLNKKAYIVRQSERVYTSIGIDRR